MDTLPVVLCQVGPLRAAFEARRVEALGQVSGAEERLEDLLGLPLAAGARHSLALRPARDGEAPRWLEVSDPVLESVSETDILAVPALLAPFLRAYAIVALGWTRGGVVLFLDPDKLPPKGP
ncbi:hypothetical protein [Pararhodospirillum photometricum]|uniref:hypothetical protein n=1 Tax=Pararhodospirillum photometricum TaxID=1084 RepID=UPI0002ED04A8|nr:hypothetical protein [Pararhodospirillum photometricum]